MTSQMQASAWTLRRSCNACARAKKRCDLFFPQCSRCQSRSLRCFYANEPTHASFGRTADEQSRQAAPPNVASSTEHEVHPSQPYPSDGGVNRGFQFPRLTFQYPSFYGVPLTLDTETVRFLVVHLTSFPATFAETGTAPFINLDVYENRLPEAITDIWTLCAAVSPSASSNKFFFAQILDTKTTQLIRSASTFTSFTELLAMVQVLILALIIRLFSCKDINDNQIKNDALLDALGKLTLRLWQKAPTQVSASLSPRQAWLFAESVRRTILTSHMLRGTYDVIRQGYFLHTTFVEALPFDLRTSLWERLSSSSNADDAAFRVANIGTKLASYREYSDMWDYGQIHGSTTFGILLLVACKGKEVVKKGLPYYSLHVPL